MLDADEHRTTRATYSCLFGYQTPSGSSSQQLNCHQNGTWNHSMTHCQSNHPNLSSTIYITQLITFNIYLDQSLDNHIKRE